MIEQILRESTKSQAAMSSYVVAVSVALVIGLIISMVYVFMPRKGELSYNVVMSLLVMPSLIALIIMLVSSDVATAFTIAGVCTLIRFRSIPGDAKDITFIFLSVTVGLAVGMGYPAIALIFTVVILVVIGLAGGIMFGRKDDRNRIIRITIPEDLNYQGVFWEVFEKYTTEFKMQRVRTVSLGTLFEITYRIKLKKDTDEKAFLDDIRIRNGNLNILMMTADDGIEKL